MTKKEVLRLYRNILHIARQWRSTTGSTEATVLERDYITTEARTLFKKNKQLNDKEEIKLCIEEGKTRLEMALHYGNPYPRPINVSQTFVPASKSKKTQIRKSKQSKPIYIHSQDM